MHLRVPPPQTSFATVTIDPASGLVLEEPNECWRIWTLASIRTTDRYDVAKALAIPVRTCESLRHTPVA